MGALYGTIKTHKTDAPIRPVVADAHNVLDSMQQALAIITLTITL